MAMNTTVDRCIFSAGDIINGNYVVRKILGNGSYGIVYLVSTTDREEYALKLLKLWEVPSEVRAPMIARFDMEFETGQIKSDFLVQSHYHGFEGGNPYIVMDYCPGGDLYSLANNTHLDLGKVASCVLAGLKSLHSNGKVHRDLKPENVLLNKNGLYVLTDFGIAGDRTKRLTERNIVGKPKQIFGTYAYMPPEQVNPQKDATVLPTTDIFSFGVMMFQLITGQLPFGDLNDERSLIPYLKNGKTGNWNRSLLMQTKGGDKWANTIEGCLQPNLKNRLQSVDDVLRTIPYGSSGIYAEQDNSSDFSNDIVHGILLRVMQGDDYGKVYYLDDILETKRNAILLLGRKSSQYDNDIEISEMHSSYVSRRHCTIELDYDLGKWVIRDGQWIKTSNGGQWLSSTNGTYVNSTEVGSNGLQLKPGDIISVGDTKLRVEGY